ncbi:ABC transporter substrate-binding protein [Streptomyces sp. NPDC050560]|uniref:ABC transporter substrate-binding protein n=1 Tax=Streptomyces sp. NPDC050560 TaxID=3365630 RepID=UPI0037A1867A
MSRPRTARTAAVAGALAALLAAAGCAKPDGGPPGPSRGGLPGPEMTSITIGVSSADPHQFALQLAIDLGIFKKYGIRAEGRLLNGVQPTTQALLSGQLAAATDNSTATITSLATSRPLVDVGVTINAFPDVIYGGKGIGNAADLRGKRVAISQLGGQSNNEAFIGMRELGLKPGEFHLTQVGSQGARISALEAGTVAAAPADPGLDAELAKSGIRPLIDLREAEDRVPGSNIEMQRSFTRKYPNLTTIIVAAALEAVQREFTDTDTVAHLYAKWAKISDAESRKQWHDYLGAHLAQRDLRAHVPGYELAKQVLTDYNPDIEHVDASKSYDGRFVDRLQRLGFLKRVGVPGAS